MDDKKYQTQKLWQETSLIRITESPNNNDLR